MKKLRCALATIALAATLLGGLALQGFGSASLASAVSSHHVSTSSVVAFIRPPCGSASDC